MGGYAEPGVGMGRWLHPSEEESAVLGHSVRCWAAKVKGSTIPPLSKFIVKVLTQGLQSRMVIEAFCKEIFNFKISDC